MRYRIEGYEQAKKRVEDLLTESENKIKELTTSPPTNYAGLSVVVPNPNQSNRNNQHGDVGWLTEHDRNILEKAWQRVKIHQGDSSPEWESDNAWLRAAILGRE